MSGPAWRSRLLTGICVISFLLITRALVPDPRPRAELQYLLVITLGYGHLIGAAVSGRRRLAARAPRWLSRRLAGAAVALAVLDLFVVYVWATHVSLAIFLPLLVVSIWHIVENDLSLRQPAAGGIGMPPVPRSTHHHVAAIAAAALLAAVGQQLLSPAVGDMIVGSADAAARGHALLWAVALGGGLGLAGRSSGGLRAFGAVIAAATTVLWLAPSWLASVSFGDFFSALTLYHLVQFLVLFSGRIRRTPDPVARRASIRMLAWVHVPAFALCAGLVLWPGDGLATLRYAVFSPEIYLFWSVLHVVQTLAVRGVERARAAAPSAGLAC